MIVTTTHAIEGRRITRYHGIVSGETVVGTNIFRDILAGITDLVGGRSGGYQKELRDRQGNGHRGDVGRSPNAGG